MELEIDEMLVDVIQNATQKALGKLFEEHIEKFYYCKLETQLYEKYINHWIEDDWDKYLEIMSNFKNRGSDKEKKAYKKIIKPRLEG